MKVNLYTYNKPTIKYQPVTFRAKSVKVNWKSESGKELEKILAWMSSLSMTSLMTLKKIEDTESLSDEEKSFLDKCSDFDEKTFLNEEKSILETIYKETKDETIMDKHLQLVRDAFENKALLRGSYSELPDYPLMYSLLHPDTIIALNILGKGTLESAFSLDSTGFENLCKNISDMQENISSQNLEILKKKINPQSSNEYKNLEDDIKKLKKEINKLLGKENSQKRKDLLEQIELLKGDKTKRKEIKNLKGQIQDLYRNCQNSEQISDLMISINEKQRKKRELVNQKVNLTPQEIINKVWTIASISKSPHYEKHNLILPYNLYKKNMQELSLFGTQIGNGQYIMNKDKAIEIFGEELHDYIRKDTKKLNKDIRELIDLIQTSDSENNKTWNDNINKKIYEFAEIRYIPKVAEKIDLANCKYLNELIISDSDFWGNMVPFLEAVSNYLYQFPNNSIDDALDDFVHNDNTKKIFQTRNIDYDKYVHYDENSFLENSITIKADDARQKAVKNMCDDLTSITLKKIPLKERKSLYKALKNIGVTVNKNKVEINGRNIKFEDLDLIMSAIKTELSDNNFWSIESDDETVDKARDTMYCHFMLQRKQEIDCSKKLKDSETVNVKVRKVNMSDIKYSLCLGNHSHCCLALGSQSNEWSAPLYILNRCISAIEVLADGEPVGNTMIYLADVDQGDEKHLALILDDIELQTKFQNNEDIKNMIIEYAQKLCAEIGQPNIPIYAGSGMHKIDMSNYPLILSNMEIIGKTVDDCGVYLDFDGEQHKIGDIIERTDLYRIA